MEVITFIKEFGLDALVEEHNINVSRHPKFPSLCLLKGTVVDLSTHSLVAYPYEKFFNYKESKNNVKWTTAEEFEQHEVKVYEKLDGSLAVLYYFGGEWMVASSGSVAASGVVGGMPFRDLFWEVWNAGSYQLPSVSTFFQSCFFSPQPVEHQAADRNKCFTFEMLSQKNVILCDPGPDRIVLHGCRDMSTLQEIPCDEMVKSYPGWACAQSFSEFKSIQQVLSAATKLNPGTHEGYVCVDKNFRRVKIKCPAYVAVAHLSKRDAQGLNALFMLRIVLAVEGEEFLAYYPQWAELYQKTERKYLDAIAVSGEEPETAEEALQLIKSTRKERQKLHKTDVWDEEESEETPSGMVTKKSKKSKAKRLANDNSGTIVAPQQTKVTQPAKPNLNQKKKNKKNKKKARRNKPGKSSQQMCAEFDRLMSI